MPDPPRACSKADTSSRRCTLLDPRLGSWAGLCSCHTQPRCSIDLRSSQRHQVTRRCRRPCCKHLPTAEIATPQRSEPRYRMVSSQDLTRAPSSISPPHQTRSCPSSTTLVRAHKFSTDLLVPASSPAQPAAASNAASRLIKSTSPEQATRKSPSSLSPLADPGKARPPSSPKAHLIRPKACPRSPAPQARPTSPGRSPSTLIPEGPRPRDSYSRASPQHLVPPQQLLRFRPRLSAAHLPTASRLCFYRVHRLYDGLTFARARRSFERATVEPLVVPPSPYLRLRFGVGIIAVALSAAAFAIAFRAALGLVLDRWGNGADVVSAARAAPVWLRLLAPAVGGLLAGLLGLLVARAPAGQGVADVMEAVVLGRARLSMRVHTAQVAVVMARDRVGRLAGARRSADSVRRRCRKSGSAIGYGCR